MLIQVCVLFHSNWVQIQHKCNTTQEQFCSSPSTAEVALHHSDKMQGGPLLGMAVAPVDGNFKCFQRTSLWQWIFVVVMTISIASLECICVYRVSGIQSKVPRHYANFGQSLWHFPLQTSTSEGIFLL